MELTEVRDYLKNLCEGHGIQVLGKDKYKALYDRDNYVTLFKVPHVFNILLSIFQKEGDDIYKVPCIRFSIYSNRTRNNNPIGLWLRKQFPLILTNLGKYGDIVYPEFVGKEEGHVLGIIVKGTKDWKKLDDFNVSVQDNIQNIYKILQGFFNEINRIDADVLENEIRQYNENENHLEDYQEYIRPNITQNRPNQPVGTGATNQGSTQETTIDNPHNLIYFGAPGTGKSYKLNQALEKNFRENIGENFRENFERVTFYPTYSYAQFVGTYKPVMVQDNTGNNNGNTGREEIAYQFVPGPFLRVLTKAINNPDINFCLVIEEINRANAAAVFGDVFQLLDRNSNGESEYSIAASEDIKKYLIKEIKKNIPAEKAQKLSIPQNMYIWATMNSADQGVFPIDTAFKRRWSFEYIGIDGDVTVERNGWVIEGPNINWNDFRRFVNGLLSSFDVNEDKLMGPYFVKADKKVDNIDQISENSFASKVLMYLWEDAARMIRKNIFGAEIKTYSQLVSTWKTNKIKIFEKSKSKWENNKELSDLYEKMNPPGDTTQKGENTADDAGIEISG